MNEDQVAKALSDKLPPEAPMNVDYPDPVAEQQDDPDLNSNFVDKLLPEERLTQMQLLDYFGIPVADRHDPRIENYLNTVYEWAREGASSGDYYELLRVIGEQEMHMGTKLKTDRLVRLGEYIKISRIRQQLAARERALYG